MKVRMKSVIIGASAGMIILFACHAQGSELGRDNRAGEHYTESVAYDSTDLLNGKFKARKTASLEYCEVHISGLRGQAKLLPGLEGGGGAQNLWGAPDNSFHSQEGALSKCLEKSWSSRNGNGGNPENSNPQGLTIEQSLSRRPLSERIGGPAISGFHPSSDASVYDFQAAGGTDKPKFQFQFSFNKFSPEYTQPFASVPLHTRRDNSLPHEEYASYFGSSGGMLLPGQTRVSNTISYGWRSGENSPSQQYSGLSNTVETENPLVWYFSAFRHPLNPVTVKTSYKSYDSNAQSEGATDLIRADRFPFTRKDAKFDAQWDFDFPFSINLGYKWQRWERDPEYWENASTDEHTPKVSIKSTPVSWLNLTASYSQSVRIGSDYHLMEANPQQPEQLLLPKFSLSDRNRTKVEFTTEFVPIKEFSFAFNYGLSNDTYDNSAFNLIDGTGWSAGASITWTPLSRLAFHANCLHEEFNSRQGPGSSITGAGISRTNDTLDTVSAAMDFALIPEKLSFVSRGSYSISQSDSQLGNLPGGTGILSRFESFLRYRHTRQLSFKCGYLYEDFGGGQSAISFRDPLTNNTYQNYSAHVAIGMINYEF